MAHHRADRRRRRNARGGGGRRRGHRPGRACQSGLGLGGPTSCCGSISPARSVPGPTSRSRHQARPRDHAGAILQLCVYADPITAMQRREPEHMYVVAPWSGLVTRRYRFPDYAAYFRRRSARCILPWPLAGRAPTRIRIGGPLRSLPVAGGRRPAPPRKRTICASSPASRGCRSGNCRSAGSPPSADLAAMPVPLDWKPARGCADSYVRVREQARIVAEARAASTLKLELLPVEELRARPSARTLRRRRVLRH